MAYQIFQLPKAVPSSAGAVMPGAKATFFLSGTATSTPVFQDSALTTAHTQPVVADAGGTFPAVYLNPSIAYKVTITSSTNVLLYTSDPVNDAVLSQAAVGSVLFPRTAAEVSTGSTPFDYSKFSTPIDVLRHGLVPNLPSAAANNTARLQTLVDPTKSGPTGIILFPPVAGNDTYYFNGPIQLRDKIHLDLCGTRLLFQKAYAASDNTLGCFTFIRDVVIENGTIEANITGTGGVNALTLMRIGSRSGYKFGSYTNGVFDKDDLADALLDPQGNIRLSNLKLKTNNPTANCSAAVLLLSGLRNTIIENCSVEGSGDTGPETGFYYEMGDASKNGFPSASARWSTSHAMNLVFRNIRGKNLKITGASPDGCVVTVVEPLNCLIDGVFGESVSGLVSGRMGEGHYKNAWAPEQAGGPRIITMRNISGISNSTCIAASGAGAAVGQFSDANMIAAGAPVLTTQEKIDLIQYVIEGFDVKTVVGNGITLNAPGTIRRGTIRGAYNGITIQGECPEYDISGVSIFNSANVGIRANNPSSLVTRKIRGRITGCKVCGSVGSAGIAVDNAEGVYLGGNQFGYAIAKGDAVDEATQTTGISVAADAAAVVCDSNFVITSGALAYSNQGTSDRGCNIVNPLGSSTHTTNLWQIDGVSRQNSGSLTAIGGEINTKNKYLGKKVWDTTNNVLRIAEGAAPNSGWRGVDGSGVLTPV